MASLIDSFASLLSAGITAAVSSTTSDSTSTMKANNAIHKPYLNNEILVKPNSDDIKALIQSNGIYNRLDMDWYTKFNRFGIIDPYNNMTTTREYIFVTKPDLNLLVTPSSSDYNKNSDLNPELQSYPFFVDMYNRYKPIMEQLQYSYSTQSESPFIAIISNAISSGLDLPGITANTIDTNANVYGTKLTYRGSSMSSDENFDFQMELEDTKYLEVYTLFKMYDEYERLKWLGAVSPPNKLYIYRKILHDQMTIYKFVVGEDGETLIYWACLTGCYPTSVPRDAFSDMNNSNGQTLSVSWKAQFVRDMDVRILSNFNKITESYRKNIDSLTSTSTAFSALGSGRKDLPIYNRSINAMEGSWSSCPFIAKYIYKDNKPLFTEGLSATGETSSLSRKTLMQQFRLKWKE